MSEFKGTKGNLERKYASSICIGIGTIGNFSQITANSILPETDEDYEKEKTEIEANMLLYSKAPELLEMLKTYLSDLNNVIPKSDAQRSRIYDVEQLIKEATTI